MRTLSDRAELFIRGGTVLQWGRYVSMARERTPAQWMDVASRRLYRASRKALYRPDWSPKEEQLRKGVQQVAQLFALNGNGEPEPSHRVENALTPWCSPRRRAQVTEALAPNLHARERALVRADRALNRTFEVFGQLVIFGEGRRIDWSMDAKTGRSYPLLPASSLTLHSEGNDPKYPWVLGRLDSLIALGQGYWSVASSRERDRYVLEFKEQVSDFIEQNPVGLGIHWTCSMEVALRGANLAQALWMFSDAPAVHEDEAFLGVALKSLCQHAQYVDANLEDEGAVPNNHLLANWVGLFVMASLFPQLPGFPRCAQRARNGVLETAQAQVHSDGFSFEGSVPYHRLATELFTLAYVLGVSNRPEFERTLKRMFQVAQSYCSERGTAPQWGDNDSGRVLVFQDRPSLEHGYLSSLGAALFNEPLLKAPNAELCDEAIWLLGMDGARRFQALPAQAPNTVLLTSPSGFHCLKVPGVQLSVSAGANGQHGVGGHNHNDKLSFELHLHGQSTIVDPGSPTYTRDVALRNRFRSTAGHNTLQCDGEEQAPVSARTLFYLPNTAGAELLAMGRAHGAFRLKARHRAFRAGEVQRTWTLDDAARVLLIQDDVLGAGWHRAVSRFYLPDREATLIPTDVSHSARAPSEISWGSQMICLGTAASPRAWILIEEGLSVSLQDAHYSPGYGQLEDARCVVARWEGMLPATLRCCVLF